MNITVKDRLDFCEEFIRNLRLQLIKNSQWMVGKYFATINKNTKYKCYYGKIESVNINIGLIHFRNMTYDYIITYTNEYERNRRCGYLSEEIEDIIIGDSEEEVKLEMELIEF